MSSGGAKLSIFVAMQIASKLSSGAAAFALSLHLYRVTGRPDVMAGAITARFGAATAASIIAGALVDRIPRGRLIFLADTSFAVIATTLGLLVASGSALWTLYLLLIAAGFVDAVHSLATQSLPRLLGDNTSLVRLNSRITLIDALPSVLAPILGASIATQTSIAALFVLDAGTFAIAAWVTVLLRLPREVPALGARRASLIGDARLGFLRIFRDPILRTLIGLFSVMNFTGGLCAGLLGPFILSASGGNQMILAIVSASGAVGSFAGALVSGRLARAQIVTTLLILTAIGGANRVLLGLSSVYGLWVVASLVRNAALVAGNGCNQAIWQARVATGELGRVLGARRLIAQGIFPIAVAVGGLIAGGARSAGADSIGYLFVLCGVLEVLLVASASQLPALRSAALAENG